MSQNPYESAGYVHPEPVKPGAWRMQYMEMYQYVFANPNWMTNCLWGGLCMLIAGVIPIVPQLVFMGYQWEIVEALHRRRGRSYPDFNTDRIMDYLMRGLWPFLVSLVCGLALSVIIVPLMFGGMFLAVFAANEGGEVIGLLMFGLWILLVLACSIGTNLVLLPITLRAGLSQDFGQAFNFGWAMSFVNKMWTEMILGMLFLVVSSLVLCLGGLLVFCIGFYLALIIVSFAFSHFQWQLYEMFLDRGGEPIPLKELPPPMMAGSAGWQSPQ